MYAFVGDNLRVLSSVNGTGLEQKKSTHTRRLVVIYTEREIEWIRAVFFFVAVHVHRERYGRFTCALSLRVIDTSKNYACIVYSWESRSSQWWWCNILILFFYIPLRIFATWLPQYSENVILGNWLKPCERVRARTRWANRLKVHSMPTTTTTRTSKKNIVISMFLPVSFAPTNNHNKMEISAENNREKKFYAKNVICEQETLFYSLPSHSPHLK